MSERTIEISEKHLQNLVRNLKEARKQLAWLNGFQVMASTNVVIKDIDEVIGKWVVNDGDIYLDDI